MPKEVVDAFAIQFLDTRKYLGEGRVLLDKGEEKEKNFLIWTDSLTDTLKFLYEHDAWGYLFDKFGASNSDVTVVKLAPNNPNGFEPGNGQGLREGALLKEVA